LKKRTKKLLSVKCSTVLPQLARLLDAIGKSFLLLFFKKEVLLSTSALSTTCPPAIPGQGITGGATRLGTGGSSPAATLEQFPGASNGDASNST
jgi:hypothetical protein